MFNKLKLKFVIMNMLSISLLVLGAFGVIYSMTYQSIETEKRRKISNIVTGLNRDLRYYPDYNFNEDKLSGSIPSDYSLSFALVLDNSNQLINIQSYVDLPMSLFLDASRKAILDGNVVGKFKSTGKTWMYQVDESGSMGFVEENNMGSVTYIQNTRRISFLDISDSEKVLSQLLISLVLIGSFMLFLILGLSIVFSKRAVAPVEAAYRAQKKFLEDASHELKTPIAAVIANTEVILSDYDVSVGSQLQWLNHIKDESVRMSKLVNGLLYLSRSDFEQLPMERVKFNYSRTVNDCMLSVEAIIFESGLIFTSNIEEDLFIVSDEGAVKQVLRILLDNAIKYSVEGGLIAVNLSQSEDGVVFTISNAGPGIPKEDISKVFDRFYRVDGARTGDGSYGIGLSIASVLVRELGGQLNVVSVVDELTTFSFKL